MANTFIDWTSRAAIAARIAEEQRHPVESWNELTALEDSDPSFDACEAANSASRNGISPSMLSRVAAQTSIQNPMSVGNVIPGGYTHAAVLGWAANYQKGFRFLGNRLKQRGRPEVTSGSM